MFETEIDSGSKCSLDHQIWLVAEGFALCESRVQEWTPWTLTRPHNHFRWRSSEKDRIVGRNGELIPAWVGPAFQHKDDALAYIQTEIDAHRNAPFDEETERARLMPV